MKRRIKCTGAIMTALLLTGMASLSVTQGGSPPKPAAAAPEMTYTAVYEAEDIPAPIETPIAIDAPTAEPESPAFKPIDIPLEADLQEYINELCEAGGVPFELVIALIERESSFRPAVVSKTNDYGLMQINAINHEWLSEDLGISDFLDPYQNVEAGIHILAGLFEDYPDIHQALMCYNCGETGAKRLWEQGKYQTTYTKEVTRRMAEIESLRNESED